MKIKKKRRENKVKTRGQKRGRLSKVNPLTREKEMKNRSEPKRVSSKGLFDQATETALGKPITEQKSCQANIEGG